MENASKALLIAGGVLFTMLIVGVIVFARDRFSEYYSSQSVIKEIEDTAEFNKQFTNYERENVTGNELISLINKIVDYNTRESSKDANSSQFDPITIKLVLGNETLRKKSFSADNSSPRLFTNSEYIQADEADEHYIYNSFYKNIMQELNTAISEVGSREEMEIESVAKDLKIFDSSLGSGESESEKKKNSIRKYNSYIKTSGKQLNLDEWNKLNGVKKMAVYKYYEYVQFKKGIFKCTGITYNQATDNASAGRVETLNFEFTGEIQ